MIPNEKPIINSFRMTIFDANSLILAYLYQFFLNSKESSYLGRGS